jgi:hypothetical protein
MSWCDGCNCGGCGSDDGQYKECVADHDDIPSGLCSELEANITAPSRTQPEWAVHLAFIFRGICATIARIVPYGWL